MNKSQNWEWVISMNKVVKYTLNLKIAINHIILKKQK